MDSEKNSTDESIFQLTEIQLAEIASAKKDIEEGLFVDNSTFNKAVKLWLKKR